MATAILIHNPTAGDGDHEKNRLIAQIRSFGYEIKYFSTQVPGWEKFVEKDAEKIFVAGGDGTVQKLAKELLDQDEEYRLIPVQVVPLGTANNIATTLKLELNTEDFSNYEKKINFDTGHVNGVGEIDFFIEGIGAGIFPRLVKVMNAKEEEEGEPNDPEKELKQALELLIEVIKEYEAVDAIVIADEEDHSGKYLLLECMNIPFIGPNFELAPNANPGDGTFELILVPEDGRELLITYIKSILNGNKNYTALEQFAHLIKVKHLKFKWMGEDLHLDDEVELDYHQQGVQVKNVTCSLIFHGPDAVKT